MENIPAQIESIRSEKMISVARIANCTIKKTKIVFIKWLPFLLRRLEGIANGLFPLSIVKMTSLLRPLSTYAHSPYPLRDNESFIGRDCHTP